MCQMVLVTMKLASGGHRVLVTGTGNDKLVGGDWFVGTKGDGINPFFSRLDAVRGGLGIAAALKSQFVAARYKPCRQRSTLYFSLLYAYVSVE